MLVVALVDWELTVAVVVADVDAVDVALVLAVEDCEVEAVLEAVVV